MQINISNLSEGSHTYDLTEETRFLGLSENFSGQVNAHVTLEKSLNQILATVSASVKGIFICDRCARDYESDITTSFHSVYSWDHDDGQGDDDDFFLLARDQNIIDIDFTVQWKIADAAKYLFQIRDPDQTIKIVAESSMREIIGRTDIQPALTEARQDIETKTRALLQSILNDYDAGVEITQVQLQNVAPPGPVIDAFDDVQRARQDLDRLRNEADAYRNDVLPRARGEAQRMIQEAQGYREKLKNEAEGEAQRFIQVYDAYKQNPEVATRRMYLETMQKVLSSNDKVILDKGVQGAVPYLPLDQLRRAPAATTAPRTTTGNQ